MPTILSHPVVPLAIATAFGTKLISPRLAIAGAVASIVPDADVLAFHFGIPYAHDLGHRGFTHSLVFAVALGMLAAVSAASLKSTPLRSFLFLFVATASHGFLDAFRDGGLGIAALWPFSSERFFAPVQVIEVSPIGMSRFFSERGLSVLRSEFVWVWIPCLGIASLCCAVRYANRRIGNC